MDDKYEVPGLARALRETKGGALIVEVTADDGGTEELCIPQSQVHENSEVWKPGDEGTLVVTGWLARQREWME